MADQNATLNEIILVCAQCVRAKRFCETAGRRGAGLGRLGRSETRTFQPPRLPGHECARCTVRISVECTFLFGKSACEQACVWRGLVRCSLCG
jgi:hypothetical protein